MRDDQGLGLGLSYQAFNYVKITNCIHSILIYSHWQFSWYSLFWSTLWSTGQFWKFKPKKPAIPPQWNLHVQLSPYLPYWALQLQIFYAHENLHMLHKKDIAYSVTNLPLPVQILSSKVKHENLRQFQRHWSAVTLQCANLYNHNCLLFLSKMLLVWTLTFAQYIPTSSIWKKFKKSPH